MNTLLLIWGHSITTFICSVVNEKQTKYHTVRTVLRQIVQIQANLISLTNIHMSVHFPGLIKVQKDKQRSTKHKSKRWWGSKSHFLVNGVMKAFSRCCKECWDLTLNVMHNIFNLRDIELVICSYMKKSRYDINCTLLKQIFRVWFPGISTNVMQQAGCIM